MADGNTNCTGAISIIPDIDGLTEAQVRVLVRARSKAMTPFSGVQDVKAAYENAGILWDNQFALFYAEQARERGSSFHGIEEWLKEYGDPARLRAFYVEYGWTSLLVAVFPDGITADDFSHDSALLSRTGTHTATQTAVAAKAGRAYLRKYLRARLAACDLPAAELAAKSLGRTLAPGEYRRVAKSWVRQFERGQSLSMPLARLVAYVADHARSDLGPRLVNALLSHEGISYSSIRMFAWPLGVTLTSGHLRRLWKVWEKKGYDDEKVRLALDIAKLEGTAVPEDLFLRARAYALEYHHDWLKARKYARLSGVPLTVGELLALADYFREHINVPGYRAQVPAVEAMIARFICKERGISTERTRPDTSAASASAT